MFGVKNVLRGLKMKYSYLNAGVDIKKADKLTNIIKKIAKIPIHFKKYMLKYIV